MLISIAIPCYRSALTIAPVVEEIKEAFSRRPEHDYQIILVNDGSPDDTMASIRSLCTADEKIIGVDLSRNFSQANAKMAALPYMDGEAAVFMDDDGQHPPEGIFALTDRIREGYDVAYAYFTHKEFSRFKIFTSSLFGRISELVGTRPRGLKTSSFYALSRFCVEELKKYHSPSPSHIGYLYRVTTRFTDVEMQQRERMAGVSGYTLRKMVELAITCLTNFTAVPLRFFAAMGTGISLLGVLLAVIMVVRKLLDPAIVLGYTSLMAALLVFSGIILIGIGLLGEYLGKVYMMLSNQPQYAVREVLNARENRECALR